MKRLYKTVSAMFCLMGMASVMSLFPLIDMVDREYYGPGLRSVATVSMLQYLYVMFLLGGLFFFLASYFFKKGKKAS